MRYEIVSLGFVLIRGGGVLLIFLSTLIGTGMGKGEVRGGGVVLIGPFPIVFGTDSEAVKGLVVLTIVLIVAAYLFMRWVRP